MDTADMKEGDVIGRLRRLDASSLDPRPGFDYAGLLGRHEAAKAHARRRLAVARGTASVLVLAMLVVSVWRLEPRHPEMVASPPAADSAEEVATQPSLVRADDYLALAALEDHIANIDDAISMARLSGPGNDVQRLEQTRAELLDSYTQVRYAQMVAAHF